MRALECVLRILAGAGLTARPSKCEVGNHHVEYLGHKVGQGVSQPLHDKVTAIREIKVPTTKKEVRSFLGMVGYYRDYIPLFSVIAAPLTDLTKKNAPNKIDWEGKHQEAFVKLKEMLVEHPVLKLLDPSKEYILQTDACDTGIGVVLLQSCDDGRWPVPHASKKLKGAELNYSVIEKECLAVVWVITRFYKYLYGVHFSLETDHQPLRYLQTSNHVNSRLMRWSMFLQQFRYTVYDIKGKDNASADCLSRLC